MIIFSAILIGLSLTFNAVLYKYYDLLVKAFPRLYYCDLCTVFWFQMVITLVYAVWVFLQTSSDFSGFWALGIPFITSGFVVRL